MEIKEIFRPEVLANLKLPMNLFNKKNEDILLFENSTIDNSLIKKVLLKDLQKEFIKCLHNESTNKDLVTSFFAQENLPPFEEILSPFIVVHKNKDSYENLTITNGLLTLWTEYYCKLYKRYPKKSNQITKELIEEVFYKYHSQHISFTHSPISNYYDQHTYLNFYNMFTIIPDISRENKKHLQKNLISYYKDIFFDNLKISFEDKENCELLIIIGAQEMLKLTLGVIEKEDISILRKKIIKAAEGQKLKDYLLDNLLPIIDKEILLANVFNIENKNKTIIKI